MQLKRGEKLAIIAGDGSLPVHVADACKEQEMKYSVFTFEGEGDNARFTKHADKLHSFKIHSISKILAKLREEGVTHLTLAGKVRRTDLKRLMMDFKGAMLLARIIKSGLADNSLLTTIIKFCEDEGFTVIAPEKIAREIVVEKACLTKVKPDKTALADISQGTKIVSGIANFDVGQSLVIQGGLVLGVEAAEGTDELIKRCGSIKQEGEAPVLVKISKPNQDMRVDLPCIGVNTVELAHEYGFKGIAVRANSTLMLDQKETIALANKYKLFIVGI